MKKITYTTFILSLSLTSIAYAGNLHAGSKMNPSSVVQSVKTEKSIRVIHLNTAPMIELTHLKGIGSKMAEKIIAYRHSHGAFHTINDLTKVRGCSKNFIDRLIKQNTQYKILV
jgi:competence ComEA-like helix-hairpin-helix protein